MILIDLYVLNMFYIIIKTVLLKYNGKLKNRFQIILHFYHYAHQYHSIILIFLLKIKY